MEPWLEALYDAEQMRAADAWAIEDQGVPSLELMEAAGAAVADAAVERSREGPARVVCGKGNNGGDGLVAARVLAERRVGEVEVLLLWPPDQLSADARANLERFPAARHLAAEELPAALAGSGVVVDAIFGTGFTGAPRDPAGAAIEAINGCGAPVVAADIPSGVDASSGAVEGVAVDADATVTFHAAKVGHWVAPGKGLAGELRVVAIGIPAGAPATAIAGLIAPAVLGLLPRREASSTKFSSGNVLVVGGSRGLTGAVCLAASAAIRAGAGYATVAVPASLEPIFEEKLTEVMSKALPDSGGNLAAEALDPVLRACERADAVVLGPGLGKDPGAASLAVELAARVDKPLVIDADGLNALAGGLERLSGRGAATILTPHAGELARLLGTKSGGVSAARLRSARDAASRSGAVVVLKGDDTLVVDQDVVGINAVSAPALATAGTGDVLAGCVAALIARGVQPFAAACAAVLAHARAGNLAAVDVGPESVIASDVIEALPRGLEAP
jgi:ADP-dependent NAD(P)H-hydrate dehydratase / NAD(P)H-hydrate epimerase